MRPHSPSWSCRGAPHRRAPIFKRSFKNWQPAKELDGPLDTSGPLQGEVCVSSSPRTNMGLSCKFILNRRKGGSWGVFNNAQLLNAATTINDTWVQAWATLIPQDAQSPELFSFILSLYTKPTPRGLRWLCGHRAQRRLPSLVRWTCTLGRVMPGIRTTLSLPTARHRNRKDTGEAVLRGFFPHYGAAQTCQDLIKLSQDFEDFLNDTTASLRDLTNEQGQIWTITLQNRLGIDYLLASSGGICSLIGSECCTSITDRKADVLQHLNHLNTVYNDVERIKTSSSFPSLTEWFKQWPSWHQILLYIFLGISGLISLCCCIQCLPSLFSLFSTLGTQCLRRPPFPNDFSLHSRSFMPRSDFY
ncbi:endogenous retrovirus group PABLB member 1 Env polyprotein-like [Rhineura floridana]|uniref:endogenous retrovirus group PABLB member 1 Env polyprotein-like n=1 Tax=Rhineura floridana TaxID=261503 RepID=UPI002AC8484F|nr:endogenous retrovirus group PABLB member 1 Env polyprotein-like [Rhineura floridana]